MKVLVLHWGRTGGGPRFAVDAVEALRTRGIWTAYSSSTHSERARSDTRVGDARLAVPTFGSAVGFAAGLPRALADGRALRAFVEHERIDCVFAAMEQLWQPAAAAALRRTAVPYLLGVHDGVFHLGEQSVVRAATRRIELAASDGVMTFSRSATRTFLDSTDYPVSRVWTSSLPASAVRTVSERRSDTSAPFRFGFFGRLLPYKGLGVLVEAVRLLGSATPRPFEVEVWGAGDAPELASTESDGIKLVHRWIPEDEVEQVLGRFDAVVAPYVEASQSGVIPLAASMGVPALITPVGGLAEQVDHERTGLVADAVDAHAFARVMRRLLDEPGLARRLGDGAAERSSGALDGFGRDLETAMEELLVLGKRRAR